MKGLREHIVASLINHLNLKKAKYLILRDYEDFPIINGNDIDILIEHGALKTVFDFLKNLSKSNNYFLMIGKYTNSSLKAEIMDLDNNEIFGVHANSHIIFKKINQNKRLQFYSLLNLSSQIIELNGYQIPILMEAEELKIHEIRFNSSKQQKHKDKLEKFKGRNLNYKNLMLINKKTSSQFITFIIIILSKLQPNNKPNPKFLTFSGPDGSGKTTAFDSIVELLENHNVKYTSNKHLHVVTWLLIKQTQEDKNKTESKQNFSTTKTRTRDRDNGNPLWRIRRKIGLIIKLLDLVIFGRLFIAYNSFRG